LPPLRAGSMLARSDTACFETTRPQ
jgi:hypothetical protein